ncbi:MAG: type II toxin-antitoxin system VapC family toxin, partial [Armatimonadetes bacterium]|nr:type II toxin-antitoxin system VapC family toxin [Armatimonadota bacterium]
MTAVDTNILVYAHREDSPWHERASACLRSLAEGNQPWAIPWPCIHEFLANVTHPRIYKTPTPVELALDQVNAWRESPTLVVLAEENGYWGHLQTLLKEGQVAAARVHDARIAAICLLHGVRELWSADRDFGRFPTLKVRNP